MDANYVLAQDPDSDRFTAAERGCVFNTHLVLIADFVVGLMANGSHLQATSLVPSLLALSYRNTRQPVSR